MIRVRQLSISDEYAYRPCAQESDGPGMNGLYKQEVCTAFCSHKFNEVGAPLISPKLGGRHGSYQRDVSKRARVAV